MPLTDTACKNAKAPEGRAFVRMADAFGLYLEVTATGSKLWRWKYRHAGKEKRLALGVYSTPALKAGAAGTVSLAAARSERDAARELLTAGTDPGEARRDAKRASLTAVETSFESVARTWWASWKADKSERYADSVLRRLDADVFPELGSKPVRDLTASAFVRMAKKIEARGAAELARRSLETCGQVMRYAVAHDLADRNPVQDVKPGDVLKPRSATNFARVDATELPELLRSIMAYSGGPYTRLALQLMTLTFVRTSELIRARWHEFDMEAAEWRLPADRTKKRRMHIVPLSRQSLEVLRYLQTARGVDRATGSALVFPGERDHDKPMSNGTILVALRRMGYAGRMTGHGFRGLASTSLNEMGYRADVIEAQLAHVEGNRVRAAYNHAQYLPERRELMQAWANYVDAVKASGKVVPFRQVNGRRAAV